MSGARHPLIGTAVALAVAAALTAHAGEPPKKPAARPAAGAETKTDAAHDAMMAEMMKLAQPGPAHAKLKVMEGNWKVVTKSWYAPGEPTVTEGTAQNRMILGGRYLEQRMSGTMFGQPFEGYGLTGYDNRRNEYVVLWVDNASSWLTTGSGTMDEAGTELTVRSRDIGPDGKPMETRMVTRILDPSRHVFSMYAVAEGQERLVMEATYTRQ